MKKDPSLTIEAKMAHIFLGRGTKKILMDTGTSTHMIGIDSNKKKKLFSHLIQSIHSYSSINHELIYFFPATDASDLRLEKIFLSNPLMVE